MTTQQSSSTTFSKRSCWKMCEILNGSHFLWHYLKFMKTIPCSMCASFNAGGIFCKECTLKNVYKRVVFCNVKTYEICRKKCCWNAQNQMFGFLTGLQLVSCQKMFAVKAQMCYVAHSSSGRIIIQSTRVKQDVVPNFMRFILHSVAWNRHVRKLEYHSL